jgi:cell division protein FtsQ
MQLNVKKCLGWASIALLIGASGYGATLGLRHWVQTSPLFFVRQVEVLDNYWVPDADILAMAQVPDSIRIFDIEQDSIQLRISAHEFILEVTVNRRLPSTLVLHIQERQPIAQLAGSRVALLEADGNILPEAPRLSVIDLPVISGLTEKDGSFDVPENAEKVVRALAALACLRHPDINLHQTISELHFGAENLVLYLTENATPVYLKNTQHLFDKLHQLAQFLHYRATADDERRVEYINLHFAGQIIVKYTPSG